MEMLMFSIYDSKTQAYSNPFYAPTPGAAIRTFGDAAKDPQSLISQHPVDFHLFQIGVWDDQTGIVDPSPLMGLGTADQYLPQEPTQIVTPAEMATLPPHHPNGNNQ